MNAWPLRLELWLAGLGRWPPILAGLAVAVATLWGVVLPVSEERAARAWQQTAAAAVTQPSPRAAPPDAPVADTLGSFEAQLADEADRTRLMQQLWKQGRAAGLLLQKVDYRREADVSGRFERLHIRVPVTGSYPAVRQFSFALMSAFPSLALDGLDITRDPDDTAGRVETTLQLSLFTRP